MARGRKQTNSTGGIVAALILLVLVVVAVFIVVRSFAQGGQSGQTPPAATDNIQTVPPETPSPDQSEAPATTSPAVVTPVRPSATPSPSPTPEPTPAPTPVPDRTGSFSSNTGTNANIRVDWASSAAGGGNVELTVRVYLVSYSIYVSEKWHGLTITVNGTDYAFDSQAISYDGSTQAVNLLGSTTVTVPAGSVQLSAKYAFRGSYSGVELDDIVASGTADTN